MKKLLFWLLGSILIVTVLSGSAFAAPSIWGKSTDEGNYDGYVYIQNWLDANGYSSVNAKTGYELGDKYYWDSGDYSFSIVKELAGNAEYNTVGYYTKARHGQTLTQLFAGTDGVGSTATADIAKDFGLYLTAKDGSTWYTFKDFNDKQIQAVIYTLEDSKKWLVCWEDSSIKACGSDHDYNDMMVTVTATPEPLSAGLFLIGGGALAVLRRKNRKLA